MNDSNTKIIERLCAEYYSIIGADHHKDKDCHFYISQHFRYDCSLPLYPPTFQAQHYGYIRELYGPDRATLEEAQQDLIDFLEKAIVEEQAHFIDGE